MDSEEAYLVRQRRLYRSYMVRTLCKVHQVNDSSGLSSRICIAWSQIAVRCMNVAPVRRRSFQLAQRSSCGFPVRF